MLNRKLTRREILFGTAGIGTILGLTALPGRGLAMSEEQLRATSELGIAYANRCSTADGGAHAQLIGDMQAMLMQRSGAKGEVLTQTAICPFCGCAITATRTVE